MAYMRGQSWCIDKSACVVISDMKWRGERFAQGEHSTRDEDLAQDKRSVHCEYVAPTSGNGHEG
jgi:hypothetical protein